MVVGTSHFITRTDAIRYYSRQESNASYAEVGQIVDQKIAEGLIHIGRPKIGPFQRLITLDGMTRYGIVDI